MPWTRLSDVGPLVVAAVGITLVSLADTIATASSFGARRGEEVRPNQEMIGIGAANLAAGLSKASRSPRADPGPPWSRRRVPSPSWHRSWAPGGGDPAPVPQLLALDLPQSALAAVLIGAALSLLNLDALRRYYRVRRSALMISLTATAGVVVLGVLKGIVDRHRAGDPALLSPGLAATR